MKLTEIAIEGNTHSGRYQFGPLDRGLNFVYGENGAGKTFLSDFLRGLLKPGPNRQPTAFGHAACSSNLGSCVLRQTADLSQPVQIESAQNCSSPVSSVAQMTGSITPFMYDTLFNFSLRESTRQRHDVARLLHENFAVAIGPEAADLNASVDHQPQVQRLQTELTQLHASIETLNQTRNRLAGEISLKQTDQNRLFDLNQQIDQLTAQLNRLNRTQLQSRLASVDHESQTLQSSIDRIATTDVAPAPTQPTPDSLKHLYQRLDEVDQQIKRWRHVQSDIQNQRVRLKDEMIVWNEMTLESNEHPYHNAREILIGLESRVDQAEQTAARWSGITASQVDVTQMATAVEDICGQMRDDLYSLCAELSSQYKHIRQRAAAVELKQLRRCYHEMGDNTARLVERRQQVIDEIRSFDPAGADAIQRSEQAFCQCAAHEGYLSARTRFVGNLQSPAPTHTHVGPDLSAERARLSQLNVERNEIVASLNRIEIDAAELERQLSSLILQRDSMSVADASLLDAQLRRADEDLRSLETSEHSLRRQLDELTNIPVIKPSQILIHAGQLLHQMTQGSLTQVFLSHHHARDNNPSQQFDLQIRDAMGRVHNFTGVDQAGKNHVYLSLALAMVSALRSSSVEMAVIIDDAFVHIGPDHATATLNTLDQFCRQHEQQIILLSQHYYLTDRLPTMPRFELPPPSAPTRLPQEAPLRTSPVHLPEERFAAPTSVSNIHIDPRIDDQTHRMATSHNRPYPLSKYPASPATVDVNPELDSDFRLPWSPLNRSVQVAEAVANMRPTSPETFTSFQNDQTPVMLDSMSLASTGLFELSVLGDFHDAGVTTVEQLLDLNEEQLDLAFASTAMKGQRLENAVAQAFIYWSTPGLSAEEAKLIVAIGITNPETLASTDADSLVARINQFLASADGQRFQQVHSRDGRSYTISRDRTTQWQRSLSSNRSHWSSRSQRQRNRRPRTGVQSNSDRRPARTNDRVAETYRVANYTQRPERTPRPQRQRMDHGNLAPRDSIRQPAALRPIAVPGQQIHSDSQTTVTRGTNTSKNKTKLKFYLNLNDALEAAPSIGPKTAERFESIGVITVADFLRQTAESMATRLNYKRLSADVLRTWQHQTRMVCRIPNLRGHDAQLLVACDVTEPDDLAAMDPRTLFQVIGPFSDTKEGLKIIRSGKKPDLAEVTDWIDWARHTRSLQAA